jgi:hypothetical protein
MKAPDLALQDLRVAVHDFPRHSPQVCEDQLLLRWPLRPSRAPWGAAIVRGLLRAQTTPLSARPRRRAEPERSE